MGPNRRSRVERLARNVRSRTTLPFPEGPSNGRSWPTATVTRLGRQGRLPPDTSPRGNASATAPPGRRLLVAAQVRVKQVERVGESPSGT